MKFPDHFSSMASDYAVFRPKYPVELFDWLASRCPGHDTAWDCACGSGQATGSLASRFGRVVGTDASSIQVSSAEAAAKTSFVVAASEHAPLADNSVDLVAVAAALHWFACEDFFSEVRRVVRPGGVFAAWSYGMPYIDAVEVERVVNDFIDGLLGSYWPPEVRILLDGYASIDLPLEEIECPSFELQVEWTLDRFLGFARTWSATGRYVEDRGEDPVLKLAVDLEKVWQDAGALLPISYRLDLRAGRV